MQKKLYFNPTNSDLKLPIKKRDKKIKFAFFEIGCKPYKRRSQLFHQENEFREEWKRYYQKEHGVKWQPQINKYVIHFLPEHNSSTYNLKLKVNGSIACTQIPAYIFSNSDITHNDKLFKKISNSNERRLLEGIVNTSDNEALTDLIINSKELSGLRGYSAEFLMQTMLAFAARRTGVKYVPNYNIRNQSRYKKNNEIDMLVAYYDTDSYNKFIGRVANQPHMQLQYDRLKIYRTETTQQNSLLEIDK